MQQTTIFYYMKWYEDDLLLVLCYIIYLWFPLLFFELLKCKESGDLSVYEGAVAAFLTVCGTYKGEGGEDYKLRAKRLLLDAIFDEILSKW